jgi:hypothetical protein
VAINSANCGSAMAASARAEAGLEAAERLGDAINPSWATFWLSAPSLGADLGFRCS